MNTLQQQLEASVARVPWKMLARHIIKKVGSHGAVLTPEDEEYLEDQLRSGTGLNDVIDLPSNPDVGDVTINLTTEDEREVIERVEDFLERKLPDLVTALSGSLSESMLAALRERWRDESRAQAREVRNFRKRLERHWRAPLESMRMLLTISRELGNTIDDETEKESPHLVEVLRRLHARACQVMDEIIVLLAAGFADGAMARWRTLHEIATVALVLQRYGEELALRYVAHEVVEARNAVRDYVKCCIRLNYDPLTTEEVEDAERAAEAALTLYGKDFKNQYGWAAAHLGKRAPRMDDLERAVATDHLRAHYRMASHNVHANPKGVFFKLGLLDETDMLLAGPSNAGLTDPGHSAAISLAQTSSVLLTLSPTLDNIVVVQVMLALVDEIGETFAAADDHALAHRPSPPGHCPGSHRDRVRQ